MSAEVIRRTDWRMRATAVAAVVLALAATVVVIANATSGSPRPDAADALAASLMDEIDSSPREGTCVRRDAASWSCAVADASGSGGADYAVTVETDRCWTARLRKNYGENPPGELSGCLN